MLTRAARRCGRPGFRRVLSWARRQDWTLALFVLPVFVYFFIFHYVPLYGIQLAFKDFWAVKGIAGSPWVGLENFERFFQSYNNVAVILNTLFLGLFVLAAGFPMPILLALMLHNSDRPGLKRAVQNLSYIPHFISTVVLVSMLIVFLSPRSGIVNTFLRLLGGREIHFMARPELFRPIYVISGIWQGMGYGSIIYLAALSGIPPELYEASSIDGASRLKRLWYLDLPHLMPTAMLLLIMNCGSLLNIGFEKTYLMQNAMNLGVSEVISTYVYKVGLINADYGFSTAVGLFNNVVNLLLLLAVNLVVDKVSDSGLF